MTYHWNTDIIGQDLDLGYLLCNMTNNPITILLADDHQLIRDSWARVLSIDDRFQVVGKSSNTDMAIADATRLKPRIVLMDINILPANGFEATKAIRKFSPGSKVIGVSMHSMPVYVKKLMKSGASGYVTKNSSIEELTTAILEVDADRKYICDEVKSILSEQEFEQHTKQADLNLLTSRELEIAQLIKEALSSKEIGQKLGISFKTVEIHRYNLLKKLNLKNTTALVNLLNDSAF